MKKSIIIVVTLIILFILMKNFLSYPNFLPYPDFYIKFVCKGGHHSCEQNMSIECRKN